MGDGRGGKSFNYRGSVAVHHFGHPIVPMHNSCTSGMVHTHNGTCFSLSPSKDQRTLLCFIRETYLVRKHFLLHSAHHTKNYCTGFLVFENCVHIIATL